MRTTRVLPIAVALFAWLALSAVVAPRASADSVLYDQFPVDPAGNAAISVDSPTDAFDSEGAADFVVPSGQTWNLSRVVAAQFDSTTAGVDTIRVRIYTDAAGTPGSVLFDQTDASTGTGTPQGTETITLNPVIALSAGTYWLSLQAIATQPSWYWGSADITAGSLGMWRNPPDGFGTGCTNFSATSGCLSVGDNSLRDYEFQLVGTAGTGALCDGLTPTITGSGTINGTSGADVILGSSGPDDISGGGGADTICAGDGDDVVHGGGGADRIDGGAGKDQVFGQAGDDVISGGGDNDTLKGQDGADQIAGGQGNDKIAGGTGDDFLSGGDGNDHLFGNDGTDSANGSAGNDTMIGGAGDDDLHGNAGDDSLDGGSGSDTCKGGGGTDTLSECDN
ncbi:MAG TPA: calcium-binding protein [Acidimicrobiales bacterium]|nr:calcium-binding protein [Acidimicrobiales bacterium]